MKDTSAVEEENEKWHLLLESDKSQELLDQLADEALEEHRKGNTKRMHITDEGKITFE